MPVAPSSAFEPCATGDSRSCVETTFAGAYPAAFVFAATLVNELPPLSARLTVVMTAAAAAAGSIHRMRVLISLPLHERTDLMDPVGDALPVPGWSGLRARELSVTD